MKLTAEQIERLRATGIRLDREGRLWHEGERIEHLGLRRAMLRWIDIRDDGRPILRFEEGKYAYLDVEDCFLLAISARWENGRIFLRLNDDSEEELAYATLRVRGDDSIVCRVRGGKLSARITSAAYQVISLGIEEHGDGFALAAHGRHYPIEQEATVPENEPEES